MPTFREDPKIGTKVPLIKTADLNDKSVTEKKLADGSITKDKIAAGAVTSEKIAEGAVSVDEIKDLSVEESKINNKAVTNVKIGDAAVDTRTIEDKSVTNAKIADESVSAEKLQSGLRSTIDKAIELDKKKANVTDVDYALECLENKIGNRVVVEGNVTNLPDDEDLTSVNTTDGREVMKLNDRAYEPSNFSGKGYKILRKNIQRLSLPTVTILVSNIPSSSGSITININGKATTVALDVATDTTTAIIATKIGTAIKESLDDYDVSVSSNTIVLTRNNSQSATPSSIDVGNTTAGISIKDSITKSERKNILTQDMINKPNTVYEIRYDFDLDGKEITIKENCVLLFNGGCLISGIINSPDFIIKSGNIQIFKNVSFSQVIQKQTGNPSWFGAKNDGITDDTFAIQECINSFKTTILEQSSYLISSVYINEIAATLGREVINYGSITITEKGIVLSRHCKFSGGRIYARQNATAITIDEIRDREDCNRISVSNVQILGGEYGINCVAKDNTHYNAFCYISDVNIYGCKHGFYGSIRSSYINICIEGCKDNFNLTDGSLNTIIIRGNASLMDADYPNFITLNGEGNIIIPCIYDIGVANNQKNLIKINGTKNKVLNSVNTITNSDTSNSFSNPYFVNGMLKANIPPKYRVVYNNVYKTDKLLDIFNKNISSIFQLNLIDKNKEGYIEFQFGEVLGFVGVEFLHMYDNATFKKIEVRRDPNDTEPFLSITNQGATCYTSLFSNTYKDFANYNKNYIAQYNKNLSIRCYVRDNMFLLGASIYAHTMDYDYPIGEIKNKTNTFTKGDIYFATDIKETPQSKGTLLFYDGTEFVSCNGGNKKSVQRVYRSTGTGDIVQVFKLTIPLANPSYSFIPIKYYDQDNTNTYFSEFLIGLCGNYKNLTVNIVKKTLCARNLKVYIYSKVENESGTFIIAFSKGVGLWYYNEVGQIISNQQSYTIEDISEKIDVTAYKEDVFNLYDNTKGSTQQRPKLTSTDEGCEYYDSTLKKKILWNGTEWTNMDGTALG